MLLCSEIGFFKDYLHIFSVIDVMMWLFVQGSSLRNYTPACFQQYVNKDITLSSKWIQSHLFNGLKLSDYDAGENIFTVESVMSILAGGVLGKSYSVCMWHSEWLIIRKCWHVGLWKQLFLSVAAGSNIDPWLKRIFLVVSPVVLLLYSRTCFLYMPSFGCQCTTSCRTSLLFN